MTIEAPAQHGRGLRHVCLRTIIQAESMSGMDPELGAAIASASYLDQLLVDRRRAEWFGAPEEVPECER